MNTKTPFDNIDVPDYKLLVIGDIHGKTIWKDIIEKEIPDEVVFIGDYFDNWENSPAVEQIDNFNNIVDFKKSNICPTTILIGNHDFQYMRGIDNKCSGYQSVNRTDIELALYNAEEHIQACYNYHGHLFSHAGVSYSWLKDNEWDENQPVEEFVNDLFKYKPRSFYFVGPNPYGNNPNESPLWIRPKALENDIVENKFQFKYCQIVGHTAKNSIEYTLSGAMWYVDCLDNHHEYMVIHKKEALMYKEIKNL